MIWASVAEGRARDLDPAHVSGDLDWYIVAEEGAEEAAAVAEAREEYGDRLFDVYVGNANGDWVRTLWSAHG